MAARERETITETGFKLDYYRSLVFFWQMPSVEVTLKRLDVILARLFPFTLSWMPDKAASYSFQYYPVNVKQIR